MWTRRPDLLVESERFNVNHRNFVKNELVDVSIEEINLQMGK